jgi:hypothetical protein
MNAYLKLAPLFLTALISACGGGDGGGGTPTNPPTSATPVTVTANNYSTVGRESNAATLAVTELAVNFNYLTAAELSTEPAWTAFGLAQWRVLAPHFGSHGRSTVAGVTFTETLACNAGGSITYVTTDVNGNDQPDAGDSLAATFNSCGYLGATVTGSMTILIATTPTGDLAGYPFSVGLTMVFNNLRIAGSAYTSTANGDITLQTSRSAFFIGTDRVSVTSFSAVAAVGATTRTRTVSEYVATLDFGASESNTRFSGTVASSELGNQSVVIASTNDFKRRYTEAYPYQGAATSTGANGGKVGLTVVDATTVTLSLDANGDGTAEQSTNVAWDSLR